MTTSPSLAKHPQVEDWLAFAGDGTVIVRSGKVDIGQRVSAAVALVAAEELDVEPARIVVAERATEDVPDEGYSSGSRSMQESAQAVRLAAATARAHLLASAADRLGISASSLTVEDGLVRAAGTNRTISYWELAGSQPLGLAVDPDAHVKAPAAHRVLGREWEAPGLVELVTGACKFVHDMVRPGMLHARVVRPPRYDSCLATLDPSIESGLRGGRLVRDGSFLAVAHAEEWSVVQLAARLEAAASWSPPDAQDSRDVFAELAANRRSSRLVVEGTPVEGPVPSLAEPPAGAFATVRATFERPYLMHAALGPSAALAHLEDGLLAIWTHSQGIYPLRESIAEALGRGKKTVRLVHAPGAGCYGHNGADDCAFEAALIACMLPGRPILLKWTRADEHGWEPYGSAMRSEVSGSVGSDGTVVAWSHETYSDTHIARARAGPDQVGPRRLLASRFRDPPLAPPPAAKPSMGRHAGLHRNQDPLYEFPDRRIVKHLVHDLPLRTSSLRGLGAFLNVLAIEVVMDELARAAEVDPMAFRLRHLKDERARAVIEAAAGRLGRKHDGADIGHGLGFARYKNEAAYAAVAIELAVGDDARIRMRRAVIAADAGEIIDRKGLVSQLEGGMLQAASMTLCEAVGFDASGVTSRDWESYPILGFDNVPVIETVLLERPGEPFLGAGEATIGPTAAAIANAVHDATGLRLRRTPFTAEAIRAAALS